MPFQPFSRPKTSWLVVLTSLKNISQLDGLSHILWNIKYFQATNQPVIGHSKIAKSSPQHSGHHLGGSGSGDFLETFFAICLDDLEWVSIFFRKNMELITRVCRFGIGITSWNITPTYLNGTSWKCQHHFKIAIIVGICTWILNLRMVDSWTLYINNMAVVDQIVGIRTCAVPPVTGADSQNLGCWHWCFLSYPLVN